MLFALAAETLALAVLCQDGGTPDPKVERNPDVGESRHDTSPPLTEIPPVPHPPGKRVHPVLPIPRHQAPPDAGTPEEKK
jgi:hypothetical protein